MPDIHLAEHTTKDTADKPITYDTVIAGVDEMAWVIGVSFDDDGINQTDWLNRSHVVFIDADHEHRFELPLEDVAYYVFGALSDDQKKSIERYIKTQLE